MVLGIKRSLFLCILLSLFLSCKSSSVESNTKVETFLKSYLNDRYKTEFELISLEKANAPGETFNNYEAKLLCKDYDRRTFYVTITENDGLSVNKDQFPIILLEHAFLEKLDIEIYKDFPVVLELEGKLVEDKYLDGINSISDASEKLEKITDSSWSFFIYTIVDDPDRRVVEVEDMVINLLRQAYKVLPSRSSSTVYIYKDGGLEEKDLAPDMDADIVKRTPHEGSVYEEWMLAWTPKKLEEYANGFQSVVKKREVIPY